MYHRVARPTHDPWEIAVAPERFSDQMRMLRQTRTPLAMGEFVDRIAAGTLPTNAVAVTFDDGYRDNLTVAAPILASLGISATVFITTGSIGSTRAFWWDELAELILARTAAADCEVSIGADRVQVVLPPVDRDAGHTDTWRGSEPSASERQRLYLSIWRQLRLLDNDTRMAAMTSLRSALGGAPANPDDCAMSVDDLVRLTSDGTINIGAHTMTHPSLPALPDDVKRLEVSASLQTCEQIAGTKIAGFAYPYGDRDDATKSIVMDCGAHWACSTRAAAVNTARVDFFDLPRIQVKDWSGAQLARVLHKQWIDA
ncbi:hypothetical protein GCM10010862_09280 [Devosia nitrariae]|uniref:Chitooligosaccharide deacetylase n=2 Tax=Devosia nitrariae TaxID=2071872 RepID=A0ABQ5W1I0_9HYPH|nr:hypothetical protein GCM10010862_09280 [Devosia nitrariae]